MPIIWNRAPLAPNRYASLPLGSIRARGWLAEQLRLAANGLTGRLMDVWPDVGEHSAWLGGDGESWERGPYYARGLVSLAHALGDTDLRHRAQSWIDAALASQTDDGFFGPRDNPDWWARMPMLEALRLHYDATGDQRVLPFLSRYFRYQTAHLPENPLTFWGKPRGGDNLDVALWLYNRKGDAFLLDLADQLHAQTSDWIGELSAEGAPAEDFDFGHGVNRAMGFKQPAVYFQRSGDPRHLAAVRQGWRRIEQHHGQIHGGYSCDEFLHGRGATQGCELCTVVELMSSFETALKIGGELWLADAIERLAFNALPAMLSSDLCARQYFQLPNQIECTPGNRNFWVGHGNDLLFGLETGFGCCTANLHIGWPHLVHHLWLATPAGGLAALILAPSEVTAAVAGGQHVTIAEETDYPFGGTITFTLSATAAVRFPLAVRIPGWSEGVEADVNGEPCVAPRRPDAAAPALLVVERVWRGGDVLTVRLPQTVRVSHWDGPSIGIERGALVFAHPIGEDWRRVGGAPPFCDYEVHPTTEWNYALPLDVERTIAAKTSEGRRQPWSYDGTPLRLSAPALRLPEWTAAGGVSAPAPAAAMAAGDTELLELIPYGCTRLRISMFPQAARR